ncbi:MAG: cation:proton antiporter [Ketobacteraceae bacterium]|nr:cation:proton antiporter [Ketobacteraceae bacterium]
MTDTMFSQLIVMLSASLVLSTLFQRLNQPSIAAYILVGCLLGPSAFNLVSSLDEFAFISEFGVVFLLFTLGLEFSLDRLISLKRAVFLLGGIQVLVCTTVFFVPLYLWGTTTAASFVLAGALAFSSTAIVTKLLSDRKELGFDYSQLAIGILLFQDLAAVVFLILIPALSGAADTTMVLKIAEALGKGLVLFVLLIAVGKWILPLVYREVAQSRSSEIFVLSTLVIVLLSSWITHYFHMSMALGGFVIGMMLGGSQFRHQIESDIRPFKDILLGLFFVSIGLQIDLNLLFEYWHRILGATLGLLVLKTFLVAAIAFFLRENRVTAFRTGLVLSQGGEFGFALIALASFSKVIPADVSSFMLLVITASMLASPYIINNTRKLSDRVFSDKSRHPVNQLGPNQDIHSLEDHVIIGGYGRIGETVAAFLENNNYPYIAIDSDVELVTRARENGNNNVIYGDCTKLEMLQAAGISDARLVVLSFKHLRESVSTIASIREQFPDLPVIVRAHHESSFEELIDAGANKVVPEMLEASMTVASQTLLLLGVDEDTIIEQVQDERERRGHVSRL